jgi:hypothetical protein
MKRALALLLLAVGCAHRPPAQSSPAEVSGIPPRGQPPPRLGEIPLPPPDNGGPQTSTTPEQQERFGELQGEAHKEEARRQAQSRETSVDRVARVEQLDTPVPPLDACTNVPPRDRAGCPLGAPDGVERLDDLPGGIRLVLKPGPDPNVINRAIACHKALAASQPARQPLCPYLDPDTSASAHAQGGRAVIDLTGGDTASLRTRVRSAFQK